MWIWTACRWRAVPLVAGRLDSSLPSRRSDKYRGTCPGLAPPPESRSPRVWCPLWRTNTVSIIIRLKPSPLSHHHHLSPPSSPPTPCISPRIKYVFVWCVSLLSSSPSLSPPEKKWSGQDALAHTLAEERDSRGKIPARFSRHPCPQPASGKRGNRQGPLRWGPPRRHLQRPLCLAHRNRVPRGSCRAEMETARHVNHCDKGPFTHATLDGISRPKRVLPYPPRMLAAKFRVVMGCRYRKKFKILKKLSHIIWRHSSSQFRPTWRYFVAVLQSEKPVRGRLGRFCPQNRIKINGPLPTVTGSSVNFTVVHSNKLLFLRSGCYCLMAHVARLARGCKPAEAQIWVNPSRNFSPQRTIPAFCSPFRGMTAELQNRRLNAW